MDRVSEQILNDFSKSHGIEALDESKRFEHLACYLAVGLHCDETVDTSEMLMGHATGIDGVAVIVNGVFIAGAEDLEEFDAKAELDIAFVFVQADRGSSFDSAKIGTFGHAVLEFFSKKSSTPRPKELKQAVATMEAVYKQSARFRRNPICRLYYTTTGTWNDNDKVIQSRVEKIESDLKATNLFRDVRFVPHGADKVQSLYRQRTRAVERQFSFIRRVTLPGVAGVTEAYIGYLPLPELLKIISDRESGEIMGSLFYSNPRDWQSWNDVNSEIKKTVESDARSRFVLMNNGITIIAKEIRSTGDSFVIADYQIVNGCQTSHALLECAEPGDESISVPLRLIGTDDETIKNDIIRATNRQTHVTEDQFFALQEFPKHLEDFFRTFSGSEAIYYERRSRQYDREGVEKTRVITHANTVKAFAAMFLGEPHRTTRNYAALRSKMGKEMFASGHAMEPYYVAAYALYRLEYLFRNAKLDTKFKPARFHILMAVRMLGNPADMPGFQAKRAMERFCKPIREALWQSDDLLMQAAQVVEKAVGGEFDRDTVRTEPVTQRVKEACGKAC